MNKIKNSLVASSTIKIRHSIRHVFPIKAYGGNGSLVKITWQIGDAGVIYGAPLVLHRR